MTLKTLSRAIKRKKPAVIREGGIPRYVVLDWDTYQTWEEMQDNFEDAARLAVSLADPKNRKRIPFSRVKKLLKLS